MPPVQKRAARKTSTTRKKTARKPASARKAASARKSPVKSSVKPRVTAAARARYEANGRAVARIKKALEATEKEMKAFRGNIEAGGRDLRKDVGRLLRDARRDVEKMNKTVLRDLQRVQKDLASAGKAKPKPARKAARGRSRTTSRGRSRAS